MTDENKKDRRDNSFTGAAGVHYAAYKLTLKGMLALPTVRNTPGTDLIVTSRDGRQHANIQVKTSQYKRAKFWIICSAKKFEEPELKASENDCFLLLRPRRDDDAEVFLDSDGIDEFGGFMLTAQEANQELRAHLNYWKEQGKSPNFSLASGLIRAPNSRSGDYRQTRRRHGATDGNTLRRFGAAS